MTRIRARRSCLVALAIVAVISSACASARRAAIVADQSFAAAVFAIDDAEWKQYETCRMQGSPSPECELRHQRLNPPIKKALADVKTVTLAIKATPDGVPSSLADLLTDLHAVQVAAAQDPAIASLVSAATTKALALLTTLTGGGR